MDLVSTTTPDSEGGPHTMRATFKGSGKGENIKRELGTPAFFCSLSSPHEQAVEVVLGHAAIAAAVLKQKTRQGRCDHPVLVPVGPALQEGAHAIEQHLRHLSLQADPCSGGQRTLCLLGRSVGLLNPLLQAAAQMIPGIQLGRLVRRCLCPVPIQPRQSVAWP